jgi:2-iminobutanoate/2-iminopropanoate deaminase
MTKSISLKRSKQISSFVPAPSAVRAGDYIYTSSIYPIDDNGHAVVGDTLLGESGASTMEIQSRLCLESLKSILKEMDSDLSLVLKVEVNVVDPDEFYEFKLVWNEYFPENPPARTTVEVGDNLPFPGSRLSIDAVALSADSDHGHEALQDPENVDAALKVEGASHAVRAGNFVFCSAFPASDFDAGLAVGKRPGFPNYGSDAEMQANHIFTRLNRVLSQVNTSVAEAVESQLYLPKLIEFHDVDGIWKKFMSVPPPRSAMGVKGLILPGATFAPNLTVLIPDENHVKQESHKGLRWHPTVVRNVNFSPTVKAGQWRFFAGQIPSPDFVSYFSVPEAMRSYRSNIEEQTRLTMEMLKEQLEANETDWAHCHHARVYLVEPRRDYRGFMRVWKEYFPDPSNAPALAFVPTTGIMFPGPLVEIDPTCVQKS